MRGVLVKVVVSLLAVSWIAAQSHAAVESAGARRQISLDGTWQIAEGSGETPPSVFPSRVPVPGLVDLAEPKFEEVGQKSSRRNAFWYRREFTIDGPVPEIALLKLHKAKYGSKVWLNGQLVGEHLPCFTPGYFDVKPALRGEGQTNELIIRVGADREAIPPDTPSGWDFEKYRYIPGIYDSVELILTGKPAIRNVQIVPEIDRKQVRVIAEIDGAVEGSSLEVRITTAVGRSLVAEKSIALAEGQETAELVLPMPNCRLWSPEDPFLYRATVTTEADGLSVRFGMRSFGFDPVLKCALLNGKPYRLRGSNITLYRFFEDDQRGDLPWNKEWVRMLHRRCKEMHWNALRYCIGFPPEFWYDIADEEGILIQDEFPIWLLSGEKSGCPEYPLAEKIVPQYRDWMRERWNHPCVVIWDAQNESFTPETGKALSQVRHLDRSNRPWENGWGEPQAVTDCVESHPYLFIRDWTGREPFRMSELAEHDGTPRLQEPQKKRDVAIIINEYAWLWLTRDGDPTSLTHEVYENLLGPNSTREQRRELYARYLAALTEFWRAKGKCAGVLEFCMLGYSRPGDKPRPEGGATSDHWIDVKNLVWEPHYAQYVRDAFAPVGVMLDLWDEKLPRGERREVAVYIRNDLQTAWHGTFRLRYDGDEKPIVEKTIALPAMSMTTIPVVVPVPASPGKYTLVAELVAGTSATKSVRNFVVE
ncbi:MAG: hypothetical protein D6741_06500 [Planctomycetota bacterium]|nr:MAG: hypothetical protein D6741_06500 [Planctomycetota bacterium]